MKTLGVKQFHQKTYKLLDLGGSKFAGTLGDVPKSFILVVYGYSGNGKTEFCVQLAKELTNYGKVAWLSYEQRHGYDLQKATMRNNMQEAVGNFLVIDPIQNLPAKRSLMQDLDLYLSKRNSPDFVFIDSLDYTRFTWDEYTYLKNKYAGRKTFVFIAHSSPNGRLHMRICDRVLFDGGMGIHVRDFIATPVKNRYGGFEPFVVYESEARKRNPLYFEKL